MNTATIYFFFFQAEDGIRDIGVTGVQTCALPISRGGGTCRGGATCGRMFVARTRTLRSMFSGRFPVLTGTGEADLGRVAPVHAVLEAPLLDPQAGGLEGHGVCSVRSVGKDQPHRRELSAVRSRPATAPPIRPPSKGAAGGILP